MKGENKKNPSLKYAIDFFNCIFSRLIFLNQPSGSYSKLQVINLFGPPGVGKSVISPAVYAELSKNGLNVELCTEYAKSLVYEQRTDILKTDQLYVLAKQNRKLYTLQDKNLDYVVIDSPLFLQMIYNNPENLDQVLFEKLVVTLFNKYNNFNIYLERGKEYSFQLTGRIHNEEESKVLGEQIKSKLEEYEVPYISIKSNSRTVNKIVSLIYQQRLSSNPAAEFEKSKVAAEKEGR